MSLVFRFRLAARIGTTILIALAVFGFSVAAAARANESDVQAAEAGLDPDKPNITEAASAAATRHYDNASIAKTRERYQVFLQGINRDWLIDSHRIYLSIKHEQPSARDCEINAEQLEKSGRAAPFSLGIV